MSKTDRKCPVCDSFLCYGKEEWHYFCPVCSYEGSELESMINDAACYQNIDETAREHALFSLREKNFKRIVHEIRKVRTGKRERLLDIGAAHGWFLDIAGPDFDVLGLEPDAYVCDRALSKGKPMRRGRFPEHIRTEETFDVIVFNDVFEHLPDADLTLTACRKHLNAGGVLFLTLPDSRGILYRLAKLMRRAGIRSPFERMWQKGLASPHIHYFNADNLAGLVSRHGFIKIREGALPSLAFDGLFQRICYTGQYGHTAARVIWLGLVMLIPLLSVLPQDILWGIYQKK